MTDTITIRRIVTARGSHIEPPLDDAWTDLQKLQWHAAVILVDTGLEIGISEYGECGCRPGHGAPTYMLTVGPTHIRHDTYLDLWHSMNDMAIGFRAAFR